MGSKEKKIKCVVWDLDNTLWSGTLLEDESIKLNREVIDVIRKLDARGILNSIASKNDYDTAMGKLKQFGVDEYFLYPQISWNIKSNSVKNISQLLNIGIDTLAFVDDQPYELDEVNFSCPEVLCISADNVEKLLDMPEFHPRFITGESKQRRQMYQSDIKRKVIEERHEGPKEEFLASLDMICTIKETELEDLRRAEELTVRTNQLNTTGYTYSYEELKELMYSPDYKFYVCRLDDKFGTYGNIGIALIKCQGDVWIIKLLLMSCRVMTRGVGIVFMNYIINKARESKVRLLAEFIHNDRNRMMYVTYKFGGFKEISEDAGIKLLEHDLKQDSIYPPYVQLRIIEKEEKYA
jgi:FkbH-like protein